MEVEKGKAKSKMEDYEVMEQIGRGPLGDAFLMFHTTEQQKYAMKKVSLAKHMVKFKRTAYQEGNLSTELENAQAKSSSSNVELSSAESGRTLHMEAHKEGLKASLSMDLDSKPKELDHTGVPTVVDLDAVRDVMNNLGSDPIS